jgi:hypothetical protein
MPASTGPFCFRLHTMQPLTKIRSARYGAVCALILACASMHWTASAQAQDATTSTKSATTAKAFTAKSNTTHATAKHSRRKKAVRGQQKIDSDRAREIQEALIREHYLSGEPTGTWNQASEGAMRRYQEDHGWQTKEVPDSRALIKLGLGPSKDHLLNPESAMTTVPDAPHSDALHSDTPVPASHTSPPVSSTPTQTPAQSDPPSPQ